jgi:surfeit locus 1 family protein
MTSKLARTIAALGALCVLIALGIWQLERRAWKNDLVARLEQALASAPANYEPGRPGQEEAREFMRVRVRGEFQGPQTIKVLVPAPQAARARTQEGFGYQLFTPFGFEKGIVFINRGFVPGSLADKGLLAPEGEVTIIGIVRRAVTPQWFTPPPEPAKRLFYAADIPAMIAAAGLQGSRAVAYEYIEAETAGQAADWPLGRDPRDLLAAISNRHLEYALTWFGLAAVLAVVFGLSIART